MTLTICSAPSSRVNAAVLLQAGRLGRRLPYPAGSQAAALGVAVGSDSPTAASAATPDQRPEVDVAPVPRLRSGRGLCGPVAVELVVAAFGRDQLVVACPARRCGRARARRSAPPGGSSTGGGRSRSRCGRRAAGAGRARCGASVCRSTLEVASSRTRMRGSAISARANAISWRWPAESWAPRSPTSVS